MKWPITIVLVALIIAAALFLGSDRYYRITYDQPRERDFSTPVVPTLPPAPVAPKSYEEEVIKTLLEKLQNGEG